MELQSAPIFDKAGQLIEMAVSTLEILWYFPDHAQARAELAAFRNRRDVLVVARAIVATQHEADPETALRKNPESCPRCKGSGHLVLADGQAEWLQCKINAGQKLLCGCPLAEAMARGRTLEQDAIDRGIEDRAPDPFEGSQLSLLNA